MGEGGREGQRRPPGSGTPVLGLKGGWRQVRKESIPWRGARGTMNSECGSARCKDVQARPASASSLDSLRGCRLIRIGARGPLSCRQWEMPLRCTLDPDGFGSITGNTFERGN